MKSKIYTRTGDDGTTSLIGGKRVPKNSVRIEAYGMVDELNSWLGLIVTTPSMSAEMRDKIRVIQNRLFDIGAILATAPDSEWKPAPFKTENLRMIETLIDDIDKNLPTLKQFILPGGCADSARAQIARTVARRAERAIIALSSQEPVDPVIISYINRISDLLFVMSRDINCKAGEQEICWQKD